MTRYTPMDWYWVVAGDATRAWSSAALAYVSEYPADRHSRIASEAELRAVLRTYGLRGPGADASDIKAECQRRIIVATGASDLTTCMIKQSNANMRANALNDKRVSGGTLTPTEEAEAAALRTLANTILALRARSNALEAMTPIPADYDADKWWTI